MPIFPKRVTQSRGARSLASTYGGGYESKEMRKERTKEAIQNEEDIDELAGLFGDFTTKQQRHAVYDNEDEGMEHDGENADQEEFVNVVAEGMWSGAEHYVALAMQSRAENDKLATLDANAQKIISANEQTHGAQQLYYRAYQFMDPNDATGKSLSEYFHEVVGHQKIQPNMQHYALIRCEAEVQNDAREIPDPDVFIIVIDITGKRFRIHKKGYGKGYGRWGNYSPSRKWTQFIQEVRGLSETDIWKFGTRRKRVDFKSRLEFTIPINMHRKLWSYGR